MIEAYVCSFALSVPRGGYTKNDEVTYVNKLITWTKRLILTSAFLVLIATNVLTLTHTAFNAAVSGLMSTALVPKPRVSLTRFLVQRRNMVLRIIDIHADIDSFLFRRRLRYSRDYAVSPTALRFPIYEDSPRCW